MKAVVGASSFADANEAPLRMLEKHGIEVVKNPFGRRMTEEEIIAHLEGADGLLAGLEPLNENVFTKCPSLKVIARIGIGMDNVDQEAAKRHGIRVSNTPEGPTEAVAEMTLTMLLTLLHQVKASDQDVHQGVWKKRIGRSIHGFRVLVIGCGRIGRRTAELMRQMGADVRGYDKYNEEVSEISLEDGLVWADAVSLHVSGKDEVIGEKEIGLMKEGSYILNSARGAVVNEDALYEGLKSGKVAGFWGDALWQEPYEGKLRECANAILTPHICTYTAECRESMEMQAAINLVRDLDA